MTRESVRRLVEPGDDLDGGESLEQFAARVGQAAGVSLRPALRAARVDLAEVLRSE